MMNGESKGPIPMVRTPWKDLIIAKDYFYHRRSAQMTGEEMMGEEKEGPTSRPGYLIDKFNLGQRSLLSVKGTLWWKG